MTVSDLDQECGESPAQGEPALLVVEDAPPAREWLVAVLNEAFRGRTVLDVSTVGDAMALVHTRTIDIALIDLCLPDGSGVDVINAFARSSPSTRCVITTAFDDDEHLMPALAAGAVGYLLKNQPVPVLVEQLRLLSQGVLPLAPSIAQRLLRHFAAVSAASTSAQPAETSPDDLTRLSEREKQVLKLIAKGLHVNEVAQALDIAASTVCSHVKNIYRKRNLCSRAEAALEAKRLGLV
jgi:DNA-binding NarL/FixJ family response regulator